VSATPGGAHLPDHRPDGASGPADGHAVPAGTGYGPEPGRESSLVTTMEELLRQRYVTERAGLARLAQELGMDKEQLRSLLVAAQIPIRPPGNRPVAGDEANALVERYKAEGISARALARKVNMHHHTVERALRAAGTPMPRGRRAKRPPNNAEGAELRKRYEAGVKVDVLAKEWDVQADAMRTYLKRAGVVFTRGVKPGTKRGPRPVISPEAKQDHARRLKPLYDAGASYRALAELTGLSYAMVRQILRDAGTDIRPPSVGGAANRRAGNTGAAS
jgi:transposase